MKKKRKYANNFNYLDSYNPRYIEDKIERGTYWKIFSSLYPIRRYIDFDEVWKNLE